MTISELVEELKLLYKDKDAEVIIQDENGNFSSIHFVELAKIKGENTIVINTKHYEE